MKAFIFTFLLFVACSNDSSDAPFVTSPTPTPVRVNEDLKNGDGMYRVEYLVTGSAERVSLTYENSNGGTNQFCCPRTPWRFRQRFAPGAFVFLLAQNQDRTGCVTTTINLIRDNGTAERFKRSTSSGAFVIASSSGSLPD